MKKVSTSVFLLLFLLFIAFEILTNSKSILESVNFSFEVWQNNIFPSLFPFFILSEFLIQFGFVELMQELSKKIMYKLFKINGYASFILIMSLISGFPSSAKYTKELYLEKKLSKEEATKILCFSHFSNPLFILGTVSIFFLENKEAGIIVLIFHYLTNVLIGIIFRNYSPSKKEIEKISLKKAIYNMHERRIKSPNIGIILSRAISNTINTLLLILGTVTVFLVLTTIIDKNLTISTYYQSILNGILEMTQGLKYVGMLEIPIRLKSVLTVMILSFGGLSVHIQIISILSDTDIKYLPFLASRLLHCAISGIGVYLTFNYIINFL